MREIAPRALTASEEATLAEASRLLGDDPSPTPDVAALRWRRARIYLAAHHWIEAGVALHELAFEHVGTDAGLDAAIPYLEALDVLGSRASPPRATCYDDMSADVPRLVELHCGAEARRWSPPCRTLTQILVDLTRIRSS